MKVIKLRERFQFFFVSAVLRICLFSESVGRWWVASLENISFRQPRYMTISLGSLMVATRQVLGESSHWCLFDNRGQCPCYLNTRTNRYTNFLIPWQLNCSSLTTVKFPSFAFPYPFLCYFFLTQRIICWRPRSSGRKMRVRLPLTK